VFHPQASLSYKPFGGTEILAPIIMSDDFIRFSFVSEFQNICIFTELLTSSTSFREGKLGGIITLQE